MIAPADLTLFEFADTPEAAWDAMVRRGLKAHTAGTLMISLRPHPVLRADLFRQGRGEDEPTTALDVTIQAQILDFDDGPSRRIRHGDHRHRPQHGRGLGDCRPGSGDVCRPHRRGGAGRTAVRPPAAPYTCGLLEWVPSLEQDHERLVAIQDMLPDLARRSAGRRFSPAGAAPCRPALRPSRRWPPLIPATPLSAFGSRS